MEAIIAAPISSFSLSTRPMIFPAGDTITLEIHSQHEVAGLTLDGQVMAPLMDDDVVTITRAEFYLKFVRFPENSFYEVLRRKLHWGVSPHNKSRE
jgi:NAD+ kinase